MNYFPDLIREAVNADIIVESDAGTYLGWFDRGKRFDRTQAPEGQPIWRIRFVEQSIENGSSVSRIKYPNGRDEYEFVWNERESLTYNYRK